MKLTRFNRRILRLALVWVHAAAAVAFGANSYAGTATGTMLVSVEVISNCTVSTVPAASGSVTTACSDDTSAAVISSQGARFASSDPSSAVIDQGSMPESENPTTDADSGGIVVVTVLF